jgi:hypothetical protein
MAPACKHCGATEIPAPRGQVLIIAVLVLFAVASVAALLAAIVGAQIAERYGDVAGCNERRSPSSAR